jgi:hypothetical protein
MILFCALLSFSVANENTGVQSQSLNVLTSLAPQIKWAQRRDRILIRFVENHITNEVVNVTRRGLYVAFEAGDSSQAVACVDNDADVTDD